MQFPRGESGNPAGRPRGARNKATILLQNLLEGDAAAIIGKAAELAKDGDVAAIRICMDRLAPARRSNTVAFDLPPLGTATDTVAAAAAIVAAVAAGELTPPEAADLAKVIDIYLRALATAGFEQRLARLESGPGQSLQLPSFRGEAEGREPGIHNPRPVITDSGPAGGACHRAGLRPDPLARVPE
jgi:hypothetical protein